MRDVLVLGGAGFIGKELVRQLVASGRGVRLLVRSAAGLPEALRAQVDCQTGDLLNREALLRAMEGVDCVVHLARANVKTWADYQKFEIEATRQVAECAIEAGVKRFIYAGTIDSYYAGRRGRHDYRSDAARSAHRAQKSLCPRQSGLGRAVAAHASRAGIAAGDRASGDRDRPRRQSVPLGRGHVVARCRLPDLGRGQKQAAAGAGGRCGARD